MCREIGPSTSPPGRRWPIPRTCADALSILARYGIEVPIEVRELLESGRGESVKPNDPRMARAAVHMIATPQMALEAAAAVAHAAGVDAHILGDALEGEARDVGKVLAGIALQVAGRSQPVAAPCVLLSGGETTVTVRGAGRGGRNVEFLLSLCIALDGHPRIHALAGDTDGVDGQEEIAGACMAPDTLARAWAQGLRPKDMLANNDGHGFFSALGDSVITGPTLTNVNDFRAILIGGERGVIGVSKVSRAPLPSIGHCTRADALRRQTPYRCRPPAALSGRVGWSSWPTSDIYRPPELPRQASNVT